MSKFLVEPHASMALGNTCAGCQTHKHADGFINTNIDVLGRGRLYLCAGCVREMAVEMGCLQPDQASVLHGQLDEMSVANERLEAELAVEKGDKYVPLAEVIDFLEERKVRRPDEVAPAPKKAS